MRLGARRPGVVGALRLLVGSFLAALLVVLLITWQMAGSITQTTAAFYQSNIVGLQRAAELSTLFEQQRSIVASIPSQLDVGMQAIDRTAFEALSLSIEKDLELYAPDETDPELKVLLRERLPKDMAEYRAQAEDVFSYSESFLPGAALATANGPLRILTERVVYDLASLTDRQQAAAAAKLRDLEQTRRQLTVWTFSLGGAAVLFAGLVIWLLSRTISERVLRLADVMRRIASRDTTVPVPFTADRDEIGEMASAVVVFRDNARDLLNQETELRGALTSAEMAARAKSEFLAKMSHELRTPLNAILGFSDIIRRELIGCVGNRKYVEYAGDIHFSGSHLLTIINDVLDFARIDSGRLSLREEWVDLDVLLESAVRVVRVTAERAGVELVSSQLEAGLPRLYCDPQRIRQVLLNLLSNAIKFTPAAGSVRVEARSGAEGLELSVEDTGCGIPADEVARIFEPFHQSASLLTREHEGTGLGLPLSRSLVEAHGGRLVLESRLGAGTRVTLTLPFERLAQPPALARPA